MSVHSIARRRPRSPISDQKVMYTTALSGPVEQVVHFWAYEDLGDWQARFTFESGFPATLEWYRSRNWL